MLFSPNGPKTQCVSSALILWEAVGKFWENTSMRRWVGISVKLRWQIRLVAKLETAWLHSADGQRDVHRMLNIRL